MTDDLPTARLIEYTCSRILPLSVTAHESTLTRQAGLTKPPGSLGRLEELSVAIAAMTDTERPRLAKRLVVVATGDHGVTKQDVSAYPAEVTGQMVGNFLSGGAAINVLARHADARVRVVDAGVASQTTDVPELLKLHLRLGTTDITEGRANQCVASRADRGWLLAAGRALELPPSEE
jgi:nicotinate-nucleotide--dimethylbenzimidazole phosphoribosyltransferase